MNTNALFLLFFMSFAPSIIGMEQQITDDGNNIIVTEKSDEIFEFFINLDPELQIYILWFLIDYIIYNNKPIKALKKALNFIHLIKMVNHKFYDHRTVLFIKLKEIMVQKFVPIELAILGQDTKDTYLKNCLSEAQDIETEGQARESLLEKLAKIYSQSVELILAGANSKIIISHIIEYYKEKLPHEDLNTRFLSDPLFIALCYGTQLEDILGNSKYDKEFDIKAFILSWAIQNATAKLVKIIKFILKGSFDPNSNVYGRGGNWKLLHIVAYNAKITSDERLTLIKLLLEFGANKNLKTQSIDKKTGYTAYDLAKIAGHTELLDILCTDKKTRKNKKRCLLS